MYLTAVSLFIVSALQLITPFSVDTTTLHIGQNARDSIPRYTQLQNLLRCSHVPLGLCTLGFAQF
jgi:hypothetical protein